MQVHSVEAIVRALNEARVEYLIVGGLAVNAHGFARMTRDVDIVVGLDPDNARRSIEALIRIGYALAVPVSAADFADPDQREKWRAEKGMIVLKLWSDKHRQTPVDIFIYEPFDFRAEFARASRVDVAPGLTTRIVALDTLLKMKRAAGRPHDLIDVEELSRRDEQ